MPSLTPPLKWHGGKHYLAPKIVALMPPHVHYVEPYFGGGAVLLAKNPEGVSEVVNDLNRELMNFWACLQNAIAFADFLRMAQAIPFSSAEFLDACRELTPKECADGYGRFSTVQAVRFFVRCRMSLAGRMDTFAPLSRTRTRRGMNEQASAWLNAVEGLPAVHERLKRVVVLGPEDALKVIKQQDGKDTLFYLDPPYLHESRATTGEYAHEMTPVQHKALLGLLSGIKGKFLLSGYHTGMYDDMASGNAWGCHEFELPNNAAGGKGKRRMTECVWTNF